MIFGKITAWFRARYVGPSFAYDAIMLAFDAKREMNAACAKQREASENQRAAIEADLLRATRY
jgi:hypothetical protein